MKLVLSNSVLELVKNFKVPFTPINGVVTINAGNKVNPVSSGSTYYAKIDVALLKFVRILTYGTNSATDNALIVADASDNVLTSKKSDQSVNSAICDITIDLTSIANAKWLYVNLPVYPYWGGVILNNDSYVFPQASNDYAPYASQIHSDSEDTFVDGSVTIAYLRTDYIPVSNNIKVKPSNFHSISCFDSSNNWLGNANNGNIKTLYSNVAKVIVNYTSGLENFTTPFVKVSEQ